ncbi:hypothetical protein GCM10027521_31020 [Amycolatopsis cihanbeyliensis]
MRPTVMGWISRGRREELVPCRDGTGHRQRLGVGLDAENRVALRFGDGEVAVLAPLDVGRLRGYLAAAVIAAAMRRHDAVAAARADERGR